MQQDARDAFDLADEPNYIREMYGNGVHGRQTLIARRLVERGVRYVQLWHGAGQPWDNHDKIEENHRRLANEIDQPIAALLTDLKQRGMLDETLILWGGEFGRTPLGENRIGRAGVTGRDHHPNAFSMFMAGGGAKPGSVYGKTDELGWAPVVDPVHINDFQATLLHMFGMDHRQLTFRHQGIDKRLTSITRESSVINQLLS
jgi:uncharacterized protein (DUF1501 family)